MKKPVIDFIFKDEGTRHTWTRPSSISWEDIKREWPAPLRAIRREWPAFAWPGGYPLYYGVKDGGALCPACANKELPRTLDPGEDQFYIITQEVNHEDPALYCDHCNGRIPSAYAEPELKILSVDAWREPDGGWTWNDWREAGTVSLEDFERMKTPRAYIKFFREAGYIGSQSAGRVAIEDDQYNIVLVEKGNRRPLFAIEYGPAYQ